MSTPSAPPALHPPSARWSVGTLTYTTGGLIALFCWLLWGDFALSIRERSVGPVVQLFLKQLRTSETTMVLLVSTLPNAITLALGPIVSYKSDRYRSRWGRRIPFLLIPTPIVFLSMIGIAFSPHIGVWLHNLTGGNVTGPVDAALVGSAKAQSPALYYWILGVFGLFWTLFEVAIIVSGAVIHGLINDVVPRPLLGRFYGLFRAVSLGAGIIFNYWLIGIAETHLTEIFVAVGLIFGVGFTLMCLMVKEGDYPPPDVSASVHDHRAGGFFAAVRVYFRECFRSGYYLLVFAAMMFAALTFEPFNLFQVPYAKQLNMNMDLFGKLTAVSYMVSLVAAYPIGYMVDKVHALRMGIATMVLYVASMIYGLAFVTDGWTFGVALVAHTVLSGAYFTSTASLAQSLFPRTTFGQFLSAAVLVQGVAKMIVNPALGKLIDLSGGNFKIAFLAGLILSFASIIFLVIVLLHYFKLGGREGKYVAPGEAT